MTITSSHYEASLMQTYQITDCGANVACIKAFVRVKLSNEVNENYPQRILMQQQLESKLDKGSYQMTN